ncbi:calcium/proton exchanger [Aestuariivirga sp.]|uniref:calcium/proton exchanger n=1 Tax=Aestuariivirga sp. TaxID=2650926 RepID=UPI0034594163
MRVSTTKVDAMHAVVSAIMERKVLWLLAVVPVLLVLAPIMPEASSLLFILSVLAIVPLAALLSLATGQVAARTGHAIGGLLNATLGNLTGLIIGLAALRAGEYLLVKASLAGAIVANTLFMTGAAFLLGGVKHQVLSFNNASTRLQMGLLFPAAFALMAPSALAGMDSQALPQSLSLTIAIILLVSYGFSLVFTLGTHAKEFAACSGGETGEHIWPVPAGVIVLLGTTVALALVSEIFVGSLAGASASLGLTPAFAGFIVVAIAGATADMTAAFGAARDNRLDLSLAISFGSSTRIALFVAPVLVLLSYALGPEPMSLQFWPGAIVMIFIAALAATLATASGHAAWFTGLLMLMIYAAFGATLFILPPAH